MTARSAAQINLLRADRTHNAYALCATEVGEQPLPFFTLTLSPWIDGVFINQSISLTQSAISCSLESFTCIRTTLHAEGEQQRIFTLRYPAMSSSMSHLINTHCKPYPTSLSADYWVQATEKTAKADHKKQHSDN